MTAGELRERMSFQQRAVQSDGYGNSQGDFETEFTVRAGVTPRFGGETVLAARLAGRAVATIKVRISPDTRQVTTDWRMLDALNGDIWNIRSIVDSDERGYIEMLCEKGVAT